MSEKPISELPPEWKTENEHDEKLERYLRGIGAVSLAAELNDLRFRTRLIESQRWIDSHEAKISYEAQLHDELDVRLIDNQTRVFDRAQSYMNFVVTLGYAGFFAIWNFVHGFVNHWDSQIVAVLLGSSLLVFISWTVFNVLATSKSLKEYGKALSDNQGDRQKMLEAVQLADKVVAAKALRQQMYWYPTFTFSVLTAYLACLVLLANLIGNIMGYDLSLYRLFVWLAKFWE